MATLNTGKREVSSGEDAGLVPKVRGGNKRCGFSNCVGAQRYVATLHCHIFSMDKGIRNPTVVDLSNAQGGMERIGTD